jgi:hypothetical protein
MGLGCAGLAVESHGAAVLGRDLGYGPPSADCGSVAEEVLEKVASNPGRVLTILTTKDTADALGDVTDFFRARWRTCSNIAVSRRDRRQGDGGRGPMNARR